MASFEQRGTNKLWSVRFDIMQNGKMITKRLSGYKTKKEANAAYFDYIKNAEKYDHEIKLKKQQEEIEKRNQILFQTVCSEYMENAKTKLKESSFYDLNGIMNNYILPAFGEKRIAEITPMDLLKWQNSLSGFSYNYKTKIKRYVGAIFNFADRYYDIKNPMKKVESLTNTDPRQEMLFWSRDEFNQFISFVDEEVYKVLFTVLYISGCRKGEILALGINDIDQNSDTITINKSITNKASSVWKVVPPKNESSNRTIYMPHAVIQMMVDLHDKNQGDFIFMGERPLPTTTIDRKLEKYCEKSGVKKIRIHDFRHSCASLLISKGVSIVAVSKRLGHSDIEQTLNTYSHMMPSDNEMMMKTLNEIV